MLLQAAHLVKLAPATLKLTHEVVGLYLVDPGVRAQAVGGQEQLLTAFVWAPGIQGVKGG